MKSNLGRIFSLRFILLTILFVIILAGCGGQEIIEGEFQLKFINDATSGQLLVEPCLIEGNQIYILKFDDRTEFKHTATESSEGLISIQVADQLVYFQPGARYRASGAVKPAEESLSDPQNNPREIYRLEVGTFESP